MIALLLQATTNVTHAAHQAVQQVPAAAQQAAQQIPPVIHVTVQQPPAGGMPEWVKILITAVVGTIFGIMSNIVTESIKQKRAKRDDLEKLNNQLIPELKENLNEVETLRRMVGRANEGGIDHRKMTLSYAKDILARVSNDRYTYNFEEQKALVYEVDPHKTLSGFYKSIAVAQHYAEKLNYGTMIMFVRSASQQGRRYLSERGVEYDPPPDSFYDPLVQPPKMEDNPESWFHEVTTTGAFAPKDSGEKAE
jgi:hypothetical protein